MGKEDYRRFFEETVMGFYEYLVKYVTTITDDRSLAVDIVQETMMNVWRKIDRVYGYEYLKSALRTMAENNLKNYNKRQQSLPKEITLSLECDSFWEGKQEDLLIELLQKEDGMELRYLVNQLRKDYARIILLHYYYDVPLQKIAKLMDISYNTVITWHRRALKRLGELIQEQNEDFMRKELIL